MLNGCRSSRVNHAVAVVGYGTEKGVQYWLIKNSWGDWWGDNGFIKLRRGVNACGIGWNINTVTCAQTKGPTIRPTTLDPCRDEYTNCPELASRNCMDYGKYCRKSCGLCPGMTPHETNTCPDYWPDSCKSYYSQYCWVGRYAERCCKSCKKWVDNCTDQFGELYCGSVGVDCREDQFKRGCKKSCNMC